MSGDAPETPYDVECPHCHRRFTAEVLTGSAGRYRGFKCPHCKLFVSLERAATEPVQRPR